LAQLKELTAHLVAAYLENAKVGASDLPDLIRTVHSTLGALGQTEAPAAPATEEKATPAQIRKSVTADTIISFEDGRPYRTLKRHLAQRGLTPQAYRAKWGLPSDYPIVAPSYSATRAELARQMGLGRRPGAAPVAPPAPEAAAAVEPAPAVEAAPKPAKPAKTSAAASPAAAKPSRARPPKAIDPASDEFT
jgi:predicted transcriptional regulator